MTIWFAQNSTVNIDSVDQWNDVADGSGNWLTWASLDPADILVANAKTAITINVSFTCVRITTSNADGGTAGGGFTLAAGVTVTADLVAGTTICVTQTAADESFIVGNVTAGSGGNAFGALNSSTGTITITGDVTGGSNTNAFGVRNLSSGTITITGNVTGGSSGNFAVGANNSSTGTITITGDVTGGSVGNAFGAYNNSSGRINIIGDCFASTNSAAVTNAAAGIIWVQGDFVCAANGSLATGLGVILIAETDELEHVYRAGSFIGVEAERRLYTGGITVGHPAIANVRFGTEFGAADEYEGTLIVPNPAYVSLGVETDNTVGSLTAGLDESALHTALDTYTNKGDWKATGFPTVAAFEARTLPSEEYVTNEQLANLESARLPRLS